MLIRISALLLLMLALVAAGCGGDDEPSSGGGDDAPAAGEALSKEDYIDEINQAQTTFVTAAGELPLANPKSPEDFANSIETLSGSVDELAADLEGITPPEEIADLHQQLVDDMKGYSTDITDNLDGLRSGDQAELQKAAQNIGESSTKFSTDFGDLVTQINEQLGVG